MNDYSVHLLLFIVSSYAVRRLKVRNIHGDTFIEPGSHEVSPLLSESRPFR